MAVASAMWTGQVENDGMRDLATTKAHPEGSQQPESPMPPKSRSQTTRSGPPIIHSLLEEHCGQFESENELRRREEPEELKCREDIPSRAQQSSPGYDPMAAICEALATIATPRWHKWTKTSTICTEQREEALKADPHEGRCLITNRPEPVDLCHLVARETDHEMLTKLEYVWEEGYLQLNVDSKRNLLHLRADWHHLFDMSEWMLVPELDVVQELGNIYLEEKCKTKDLAKLFTKKSYRYYLLPSPTLNRRICRASGLDEDNLFPAFADLGLLESYIHPHFIIFNTGQKLQDFSMGVCFKMKSFLEQMVPHEGDMFRMLLDMVGLYGAWTKADVPADYYNLLGTSKRARPPSRERLRSATRSRGQGSQGVADRCAGGQQRALPPLRPPEEDDSSSVTDDTVIDDDDNWIEYIHKWRKENDEVAGKWESGEVHDSRDEQLADYDDEHARTPPSPSVWDSWMPTWGGRLRYPNLSDRSQFSSNDWASFKNDVYLTRLEYPRVDL